MHYEWFCDPAEVRVGPFTVVPIKQLVEDGSIQPHYPLGHGCCS